MNKDNQDYKYTSFAAMDDVKNRRKRKRDDNNELQKIQKIKIEDSESPNSNKSHLEETNLLSLRVSPKKESSVENQNDSILNNFTLKSENHTNFNLRCSRCGQLLKEYEIPLASDVSRPDNALSSLNSKKLETCMTAEEILQKIINKLEKIPKNQEIDDDFKTVNNTIKVSMSKSILEDSDFNSHIKCVKCDESFKKCEILVSSSILSRSDNDKLNGLELKKLEECESAEVILQKILDKLENKSRNQQIDKDIKIEDDSTKINTSSSIEKNNDNLVESLNQDELEQYFDDIPDSEFNDIEINQIIAQKSTNIVSNESQSKNENFDSCINNNKEMTKLCGQNFQTESKKINVRKDLFNKIIMHPKTINAMGNEVFRFFWLDAFEDSFNQPGNVYLFGKVFIESTKHFKSCCVAVKNIEKKIYVLPRKYVLKDGCETELNDSQKTHNELSVFLLKHTSTFRTKEVRKNYAFEKKDVPQSSTFVEVKYPASCTTIDPNYSGPSIQSIFGTSFSALELFLIEKNIKGPCWLDVKLPSQSYNVNDKFSWCNLESTSTKMEDASITKYKGKTEPIPPLTVATLNIQVSLNPKSQTNEISNIGILISQKFHLDEASITSFDKRFCLITHSQETFWPTNAKEKLSMLLYFKETKVIVCETELNLLEKFLEILQNFDPDAIIGYDTEFQFEVLINRILTLKIKDWSKIGKLKKYRPPYFKDKIYFNQILCGRPICDILISAKESKLKIASFDLPNLCNIVFKQEINDCKEIKPENCSGYYASTDKLENLIKTTMTNASYILKISMELNCLPLAYELTKISGNTLSKTLSNGVSERNEFLLLHAFHANNYILPDRKNEKMDVTANKKAAYTGGLILEPIPGFYESLILLMDFNSLYPSIIQEFNICFTTIPGVAYAEIDDIYQFRPKAEMGILPTEIRKLVDSRFQLKKMLKSKNLSLNSKRQYNIRQSALKSLANSMYGCLGASHSRFCAKALAAFITTKGREILQSTKESIEAAGYEIIYGDTDSIMINTKTLDYDNVIEISKNIKRKINKLYRNIELDIDKVYKYLLLFKKKQYAGLIVEKSTDNKFEYVKEIKGLEIIKRDRCKVASDIGNQILDELFKDQSHESRLNNIFNTLNNTSKKLRNLEFPLSSLKIIKRLSKDPQKYVDDQSHAIVARRLNKTSGRKWKIGDAISYIICEDGTKNKVSERSYNIEEMKKNSQLKIDINFYMTHQIYPVVYKICEPIEGIDGPSLSQHLGIHTQNQKIQNRKSEVCKTALYTVNRYKNCISFKLICRNKNCKTENEIKSVFTEFPSGPQLSLAMCSNPKCNEEPWRSVHTIKNKLISDIRAFISKYYFGQSKCDNLLCSKETRNISLDSNLECDSCLDGKLYKIYNEAQLYKQLSFFLHVFTINQNHSENLNESIPTELKECYNTIREFITCQIKNNAYGIINLSALFPPSVKNDSIDV